MTAGPSGARPQDAGRSHSRRRRVEARALSAGERSQLLEATPLVAYGEAIRAATWLYGADELAAVLLRDVLAELTPAPSPGNGITGEPLPAPRIPLADKLKLWSLALELAGELGLTADSRRRIGLELTPPPEARGPARRSTPQTRRRPVDFGGE